MGLIGEDFLLSSIRREKSQRESAVAQLQEGLSALQARTGGVDESIASIRSKLTKVTEKVFETEQTLGEAAARIAMVETVGAGERAALVQRLTTLEASVAAGGQGQAAALSRIESLESALAEDGLALADTRRVLTARLGENEASVRSEQVARVSGDEALASSITSLSASVTSDLATLSTRIDDEEETRIADDEALASRTSTLESQVQTPTTGLLARVTTIESTYATDSDVSAAITTALSVASADAAAQVATETSARIAADGSIHAKWGVAIDVNGNIIGRVNLDGTNQSSEFSVVADKFTVWNGTTTVPVFQIVGGVVRVTGSLVIAASDISGLAATATSSDYTAITGTKPPANADVTLSAINGGLTVTGGGITLSAGGAIKGGASNFSTGTGFFLGYESGQYKFRVGDPSGARIEWDGSAWTVVGLPSTANQAPEPTLTPQSSPTIRINAPSGAPAGWYVKYTTDSDSTLKVARSFPFNVNMGSKTNFIHVQGCAPAFTDSGSVDESWDTLSL